MPVHDREQLLFEAALDRPSSERDAFLLQACKEEPALRVRVQALLAAFDDAGPFLANPTSGGGTDVLHGEEAGERVGRYKLLQKIGEGGFGTVWMAEQDEPVRRLVALKIIKRGMDTKMVVARFEVERQALAMMDHPNIAKVFDGGETPGGLPFFVMELVRGVPITQFCDQQHFDHRQRLELFVQVCHAVQHAHHKGVIHRDLKPSNVLVTMHDTMPVVKVIDFGVAKAIHQRLTDKTVFTEFRQMVGTPEYMSPEQAELSGLDIDTRADVYSLGVLLYELLTGSSPFAGLRTRGVLEMMRVIREEDPPKPSTRISTLGEAATAVAKNQRVEPKRLRRLVEGDLDSIVMKAIEKDRARRYETASAFAEDVLRHLREEPVVAVPPGVGYRLRKYVRRHRVGVVAGGCVAVSMVAGLGTALWGWQESTAAKADAVKEAKAAGDAKADAQKEAKAAVESAANAVAARVRADEQASRAEKGEAAAKREASKANTVLQFVEDMLTSADPDSVRGPKFTVREMLDEFDRGMSARLATEPAVEASIRHLLGKAYHGLGEFAKAEVHWRRVLTIAAIEPGEGPRDTSKHLNNLAEALAEQGKLNEAEQLHRQALDLLHALYGEEHIDIAGSLINLAGTLQDQGRLEEAEDMQRLALAMSRKLAGENSVEVGKSLLNLAELLRLRGVLGEAEDVARQALDVLRGVLGAQHPTVASSLNNLALVLHSRGRLVEAEELHRQSIAMNCGLLGEEHPHVAVSLGNLGATLFAQGKIDEAEQVLQQALAMQQRRFEDENAAVTLTMNSLGRVLDAQGRLPEAEAMSRRVLELTRQLLGTEHPQVVVALNNLATVLLKLGKLDEAEDLHLEALRLQRQQVGDHNPMIASSLHNLAAVKNAQGLNDEAEALLRQAIAMRQQVLGDSHPDVADSVKNLAIVLLAQGKLREGADAQRDFVTRLRGRCAPDDPGLASALAQLGGVQVQLHEFAEAEVVLRECVQIHCAKLPTDPRTFVAMSLLGSAIAEQGRHDEADPLLRDGYDKLQSVHGADPAVASTLAQRKREALDRLVKHYEDWGKPEQAAARRKLLEKEESK
ncbi:MAG: tetratricopeptide repeat protein [Planctomycetota bacterium]